MGMGSCRVWHRRAVGKLCRLCRAGSREAGCAPCLARTSPLPISPNSRVLGLLVPYCTCLALFQETKLEMPGWRSRLRAFLVFRLRLSN